MFIELTLGLSDVLKGGTSYILSGIGGFFELQDMESVIFLARAIYGNFV